MISQIKPKINIFIEKIISPISKNWDPNTITVITLAGSLVTLFLFWKGYFLLGSLSFIFYLFDLIDGAVARAHGKTSVFGGFLDAVCDRVSDGLLFVALGLTGVVSWPLCGIAMIGTFMVSYTKSKAETAIGSKILGTNELSIGYAERAERLVILFTVTFIYSFYKKEFSEINIIELGLIVLCILTAITSVMRVRKTYEILNNAK